MLVVQDNTFKGRHTQYNGYAPNMGWFENKIKLKNEIV